MERPLVNVADMERYRRILLHTSDKLWLAMCFKEYVCLYAFYRWNFAHAPEVEHDEQIYNMLIRLIRLEYILFYGELDPHRIARNIG